MNGEEFTILESDPIPGGSRVGDTAKVIEPQPYKAKAVGDLTHIDLQKVLDTPFVQTRRYTVHKIIDGKLYCKPDESK